MARTDAVNAANVANEVGTVFPGANGGRRAKVIACKDTTVEASVRAVILSGAVGFLSTVIDAALAASGWEGRDSAKARSAESMAVDAKSVDRRRFSFLPPGTPFPYGGGQG